MLPQLWSRSQLLLGFDLCYRNFICHRCSRKKKKIGFSLMLVLYTLNQRFAVSHLQARKQVWKSRNEYRSSFSTTKHNNLLTFFFFLIPVLVTFNSLGLEVLVLKGRNSFMNVLKIIPSNFKMSLPPGHLGILILLN